MNLKLSMKGRQAIVEIISALFILLFVYTASSKLFDFDNFRNTLWQSSLIGHKATPVAWTILLMELLT